jgi:hypothetical protein
MEWTQENMDKVIESLKVQFAKPECDMGEQVLYAVRFESDGDIALVHRELVDEEGDPDPTGEWYYMITWMSTRWRTDITDDMIEDWSNDGQSPWYGVEDEYLEDKAIMEAKGGVYVNV